ncbi:OmpA family protein [Providencia sneebia]|uniref:OmpA family protein n=1 Tax=Providencia sneebia TaxID=516075 RepID=UPI001F36BD90
MLVKRIWVLLTVFLISSCNNTIRDEHFFLDLDWKKDVYNIIYSHFDYIDDIEFWVIKKPQYINGSPFRKACIEVKMGINNPKFYVANINLYSLAEVASCDDLNNNSRNTVQLTGINIKEHDDKGINNLNNKPGVFVSYKNNVELLNLTNSTSNNELNKNEKYLSIVFSSLFSVNEYMLTNQGKEILLDFINELPKIPATEMVIYGIADSSGNYALNRKLADKRAEAVYQFIRSSGVKNIPIQVKGSVENHDKTALERVQQRRFIIEVRLKP